MAREAKQFTVGNYWLAKRRDGKSPDIWQIATYSPESRSVVYRSTKCRTVDVDAAQAVLRAHEAAERSRAKGQDAKHAELLPHLFNYLRERGPDVKRVDTIKSSFRAWIGFLQQDELGTGARVADVTKNMVARFRRWRMGPHEYKVEWNGKPYGQKSEGVTGETVQRNIEDLRAALNHAEGEGRITAPKVASVERKYRSSARDRVLSASELGAILGYAKEDIGAWRWICLMIASASRPGPAMAFNPDTQWEGEILDLHPGGIRSDKRNAVVPAIDPIKPVLEAWKKDPHELVKSRRKWWNTMRRVLELPEDVNPYTIRHTVTTWLDDYGVPGAQISGITGHVPSSRGMARTTSRHYLHYNPHDCPQAVEALTVLFNSAQDAARIWLADHRRTTPVRGKPIMLATVDA
jgi:integrase